jgi:hypothetical protein
VTASTRLDSRLRPLALFEALHFLTQRFGRLPVFPSSHHPRHHSYKLDPQLHSRWFMAPSNLSSPKSRDFHTRAILGPKLHDRLPNVKTLIVGAGGIGCELRMLCPVPACIFPDCWCFLQSRTSCLPDSGISPYLILTRSTSPT